jgi:hypothetical protein
MTDSDIAAGYARLYGPIAVVSLLIGFLPILPPEYGTLFEMASRPGGDPALLGIMLMGALVGCLGFAALRPPRTAGLPVAISMIAALIVVMLLTKPGTSEPTPSLTPAGDAALAIAVLTVFLGIANVLQLRRARRAGPVRWGP